jgi:hypothetical protein
MWFFHGKFATGVKKIKLEKIIACSEFIPPTFKTSFKQNKVFEKLFCNFFLKKNFNCTCFYSGK